MAVVGRSNTTNTYLNTTWGGLLWKYGIGEVKPNSKTGEYNTLGDLRQVEVIISLPDLPTVSSTNVQIQSDGVTLPAGAFIEKVIVTVLKETAGTNANLNVGLVDQDRSTEIDFQAFLKAWDAGNDGTDLGERVELSKGGTAVGDLVGTRITNAGLITANADTGDFTAGVVKVEILYSVPLSTDV